MEEKIENKKTGATPEVIEGIGGGEILGVIKTQLVMVNLRDGHGQSMVKLAIVVPGGEIHFLEDKVIGKPAQSWVKRGIQDKLSATKE